MQGFEAIIQWPRASSARLALGQPLAQSPWVGLLLQVAIWQATCAQQFQSQLENVSRSHAQSEASHSLVKETGAAGDGHFWGGVRPASPL